MNDDCKESGSIENTSENGNEITFVNTPSTPSTSTAAGATSETSTRPNIEHTDSLSEAIWRDDDAEADEAAKIIEDDKSKGMSPERSLLDSEALPTSLNEATTLVTSNVQRDIDAPRPTLEDNPTADSDKIQTELVAVPSAMLSDDLWKSSHDEDEETGKTSASLPPADVVTPIELEEAPGTLWEGATTTAIRVVPHISTNAFADARVVLNRNDAIPLPIQHIHSTVPVDESDTRTDSPHPSTLDPPSNIASVQEKATQRSSTKVLVAGMVLLVVVIAAISFAALCADGECFSSNETDASSRSTPGSADNGTLGAPTIASNQSDSIETGTNNTTSFTKEGFASLVAYMNNITLSGRVLVPLNGMPLTITDESPEELALTWLLYEDPFQLGNDAPSARFRVVQRYALRTLWVQFDIADPFFVGNECQWHGSTCQTKDLGGDIGVQNVLTEIDFFQNNLTASLSPDLGLLTHLVRVNLFDNAFYGSLPESIGAWSMLQEFSVTFNAFTGTLPASVGQWTNIVNIFLGGNLLMGTLPDTIGQWSRVQKAQLDNNLWNGTIPTAIANWTNATFVSFVGNSFTGTLPNSIGRLSSIEYFYVSSNSLTGTIPDSIANWTRLEWASFTFNNFTGSVPGGVCQAAAKVDADCLSEVTCTCCTICA